MIVRREAASPRGRDATCRFRMPLACVWRRAAESGKIDTMRSKAANHGSGSHGSGSHGPGNHGPGKHDAGKHGPGEPARTSVAIVVYDGVALFELGVACDVFGDDSGGEPLYEVTVCGAS